MCVRMHLKFERNMREEKQNDILVFAAEQLGADRECGAARVCGAFIFSKIKAVKL